MPYGISKKAGGDSAANDAKMERCIARLTSQGKPKLTAILICKSSIQGTQKGKSHR
jgi:hypothetical protein